MKSERLRLVLLSFLMLFVELALIRWSGSNVLYLSYFSNFVLLGSFLGIGVGFLRARAKRNLFPLAPVGLTAFVIFVLGTRVEIDRSWTDFIYFGDFATEGLPAWVILPVIFVAVAAIMAMIAEGVARTFAKFEPLEAYRLDILGSIAGIAVFSLLSFGGAPPVVWGVVAAVSFAVLIGRRISLLQAGALIGLVAVLGNESLNAGDSWSPYYKVSVFQAADGVHGINVNGIPHQAIESMERVYRKDSAYLRPYERLSFTHLDDVLIVGAGTGNDVAVALTKGARHIDAVEIDPRLQEIGVELHPDKPYADPRVSVHIQDGRAFLERTDRRYDLILFALPDSLTLVSGQSSLRLESYLFSQEAIEAARAHLKPQGAFAMYNYYRQSWLIDRFAGTLQTVFGQPPCVEASEQLGWFAVMVVGVSPDDTTCENVWQPASAAVAKPATDDHPFPYLRTRSIPGFYLLTLGLILLAALVIVRRVSGPFRSMSPYTDLFFMGAAFLLLETKSVVQFALLFGTTWFVNALVFAGILVSVLAAVEVARRWGFKRPARLYAGLLLALAVAWAVPLDALLALGIIPRFIAATTLAFTPIFLANLVFAQRFKDVGSSTTAFGANLLGAMVGGVLEYSALVTGYRSLLIIVGVLYGLAFVFGRRWMGTGGPMPEVAEARMPATVRAEP